MRFFKKYLEFGFHCFLPANLRHSKSIRRTNRSISIRTSIILLILQCWQSLKSFWEDEVQRLKRQKTYSKLICWNWSRKHGGPNNLQRIPNVFKLVGDCYLKNRTVPKQSSEFGQISGKRMRIRLIPKRGGEDSDGLCPNELGNLGSRSKS